MAANLEVELGDFERESGSQRDGVQMAELVETESQIPRALALAMTEGEKAKTNSTEDGNPS
jgi:hypothetical protein